MLHSRILAPPQLGFSVTSALVHSQKTPRGISAVNSNANLAYYGSRIIREAAKRPLDSTLALARCPQESRF